MTTCNQDTIPAPAAELSITLPGGASFVSLPVGPSLLVTELSAATSLMAQLGPALAALQPVLRIIDAVTSLFTVLQAAPEIPVDPTGFIEALDEAAKKIARLTPLIPQLSVPATIASTMAALSSYASAIRAVLVDVKTVTESAQVKLDAALDAGDAELASQARCELDNAEAMLAHAGASLGPLNAILGTLTGLLSFIPTSISLPGELDPSGLGVDALIEALDTIIATLGAIKIPGA